MCWDFFKNALIHNEMDYNDYIFYHEEILKIYASETLINLLKINDIIILRISDEYNDTFIECKVYKKQDNYIYVKMLYPNINNKQMHYIKKM